MLMLSIVFVAIASVLHILVSKRARIPGRHLEIVLAYAFFFLVGLSGLFAFAGHAFMADEIARRIGWQPGNPFQFEVAVANLAFGILGVMSVWFRDRFWLATAVGYGIFLSGAGVGHLRELMRGNHAELNSGIAILVADFVVPIVLIALVVVYLRVYPRKRAAGSN